MDKAEVELLIKQATGTIEVGFTAKLEAVNAQLTAAVTALGVEKAARVTAELAAHRAVINGEFETAINADTLEPKYREQFTRVSGLADDARALSVKLDDVKAFIKDNAKKPAARKVAKFSEKYDFKADGEEGVKDSSKIVALRVNKLMLTHDKKEGDLEARLRFTRQVLANDKALGESYKVAGEYVPADAA